MKQWRGTAVIASMTEGWRTPRTTICRSTIFSRWYLKSDTAHSAAAQVDPIAVMPRSVITIAAAVKDGSIAYLLNKPYNFLLYQVSVGLGDSVLRMVDARRS